MENLLAKVIQKPVFERFGRQETDSEGLFRCLKFQGVVKSKTTALNTTV